LLLPYLQGGERDLSRKDYGIVILNTAPSRNSQMRSETPSILPWISRDDSLGFFFKRLQTHHHLF
jgi:hypothetical protein